ncbi:beta-lactamase/transpeptidase-like protein [Pseudovirgaria hyperparasitica]|uniref:Beta-lactamase/transpeptidase-like protein n=1 Tax=Pseudovirgaria hyperparasitica TaxID=470096 RepID=A0A6A6WG23_9PEZI|nr:beta-lactamase/transpeptidase-like protein [Pseudovirgaria hyperparasitica]KAF2761738.1 beta-lactamase/transpeptidase-like protein [Pseudovirgaria hyperparasitica]
MVSITPQAVRQALIDMSGRFRGPGGAAAVLKDGELVDTYVWGYADMDKGVLMESTTPLPICSISKQMLCATLHDLNENPPSEMVAKGEFKKRVQLEMSTLLHPGIVKDTGLTVDHLCDNQSGIRDYWALGTLFGARPVTHYSISKHNTLALDALKSFQFEPGNGYSYANTNFNILARLIERVTGREIGDLIAERVFERAGMKTAKLIPDASKRPGPGTGYEGDELRGYLPAENNIEWAGDAGIVASLEDMIAYEKYFDQHWTQSSSWAQSAGTTVPFKSGGKSGYRMGLVHWDVQDVPVIGHSGGLRGYKLNRLYAPSHRLSIVVMQNHMANAVTASEYVMGKLLAKPEVVKPASIKPSELWAGAYLDDESKLSIVIVSNESSITISMIGGSETIPLTSNTTAQSTGIHASIVADTLHIFRPMANFTAAARRIKQSPTGVPDPNLARVQGSYRCDEIGSTVEFVGEGGILYASFDGFMGRGPPHLMRYLGEDVWLMACPRGMDAPAPGDWTIVVHRHENGDVEGVTIGCWLARKLEFKRI